LASDLFQRLIGTVLLRPYVFAFLAVYLIGAVGRMGWRKTLAFILVGYGVAFTCEFSSTRNGFPFGLYHYIDTTRERELWVGNVPLWDSMSFIFLTYTAYRVAIALFAPLEVRRGDLRVADTLAHRTSASVLAVAPVLMALLDVIIDPLTLRGERWFLGKIYYYPGGGEHFGVPISNYAGWAFVALIATFIYQQLERVLSDRGAFQMPYSGLLEPILYVGILVFNLTITFAIGEIELGWAGVAVAVPLLMLIGVALSDPRHRMQADESPV
jgi:uncharacterized membrane protein